MNSELKRMIIQSHVQDKTNLVNVAPSGYTHIKPKAEATCTDKWDIYLKINNDVVEDVKYMGSGCAISTASLSILSHLMKGKKVDEVISILDEYYKMIKGESYKQESLGELVVFENVHSVWNRVECALVGYKAFKSAVGGEHE